MPLFDIPGWSVSTPPVAESSHHLSKKRKRPSSDSDKLQSAEVNLEKLVKRLRGNVGSDNTKDSKHGGNKKLFGVKKRAEGKKEKGTKTKDEKKKSISHPRPLKATEMDPLTSPSPAKKLKRGHSVVESSYDPSIAVAKADGSISEGLTTLQKNMKQSLDGARFRLINESLYKTDSQHARQMIQDDPQVYVDYHTGFRRQVQVWPTNPVQHYISVLSAYPPKTVIADLGCGDAAIARALIPKGMTVFSFDLVSDGKFVVEADTCGKLPLPGFEGLEDEKSDGDGHVVDIAVCALSLMNTNWPNCLREAWRILRKDGELKIAEVTSRFSDVGAFQDLVGLIGFRLISKDDSNTHFTLFEFKKMSRKRKTEKEWSKLLSKANILEPCEYKRR